MQEFITVKHQIKSLNLFFPDGLDAVEGLDYLILCHYGHTKGKRGGYNDAVGKVCHISN